MFSYFSQQAPRDLSSSSDDDEQEKKQKKTLDPPPEAIGTSSQAAGTSSIGVTSNTSEHTTTRASTGDIDDLGLDVDDDVASEVGIGMSMHLPTPPGGALDEGSTNFALKLQAMEERNKKMTKQLSTLQGIITSKSSLYLEYKRKFEV